MERLARTLLIALIVASLAIGGTATAHTKAGHEAAVPRHAATGHAATGHASIVHAADASIVHAADNVGNSHVDVGAEQCAHPHPLDHQEGNGKTCCVSCAMPGVMPQRLAIAAVTACRSIVSMRCRVLHGRPAPTEPGIPKAS
jgi:hypothetical protein